MKRHLILLFSLVAVVAAAQGIPHNMVSRHTPVNTNLIGAVVGEGLTLTNGVLSSTGGGGSGGTDGQAVTNIVEGIVAADVSLVRTVNSMAPMAGAVTLTGEDILYRTGQDYSVAVAYDAMAAQIANKVDTASLGTAAYMDASEFSSAADLDNYLLKSERDLHWDSATNIVWKNVYSNGWVYLMPFARTEEVTQ